MNRHKLSLEIGPNWVWLFDHHIEHEFKPDYPVARINIWENGDSYNLWLVDIPKYAAFAIDRFQDGEVGVLRAALEEFKNRFK